MTSAWETIIGLEVHVQLATASKLFCGCSTQYGDVPNTNVCPVCLGLPGALPVTNSKAVALAVRASLSLDCAIQLESEFARKNYFYPDLPKGYQISQFDRPIATGGELRIDSPERGHIAIQLIRLHLEEDAGKSIHDRYEGKSAIDYNRTGVPLVEIVTEPDIRSPREARLALDHLKQILQYTDVSDCSMELGRLRVDANLSIRRTGESALGVKQEVKNMNSFSAVEHTLGELRDLQIAAVERGASIEQATFSAGTGVLQRMRTKEGSHDYRYFADPDLPPVRVSRAFIDEELAHMPELPRARIKRLQTTLGISANDAVVLTATRALADYFEAVVNTGADPKSCANWVTGAVLQDANDNDGQFRVDPQTLGALIALVHDGIVSNQAAKKVFRTVAETGRSPLDVAEEMGVVQVRDDEAISAWIDTAFTRFPGELERLKRGEEKLFGFFMGRVMKESKGSADPKRLNELLRARLR